MARGLQRWGQNTSYAPVLTLRSKTANYTALSGDMVLANAAGGGFTVTLPPVSAGIRVVVKKTDSSANAVTVSPQSGTIDGSASTTITAANDARTFISDGTNWFIQDDRRALVSHSVADTNTDVTVVNSAAETTMATLAVPTTAAPGDVLHFNIAGDLLNNSGSAVTFALKLKLGATTVLTGVATSVSSQTTRRQWWTDIELLVVVAASDQRIAGEAYIGTASSNNWPMGAGIGTAVGYGTAAEDLTAGKSIVLTAQMGTADANADFRAHMATLEIVKR